MRELAVVGSQPYRGVLFDGPERILTLEQMREIGERAQIGFEAVTIAFAQGVDSAEELGALIRKLARVGRRKSKGARRHERRIKAAERRA